MPTAPKPRDFFLATEDEIREGRATDLYFLRPLDVLRKSGKDQEPVVAEITTGSLPNGWPWGVLCGLEEVVRLLKGRNVSLWSLPEGSVFPPKTPRRMHPGSAPLSERSVFVGGLDAITTPLGADLLGVPAMGTMPHALTIVMGGPREAFGGGHKAPQQEAPR